MRYIGSLEVYGEEHVSLSVNKFLLLSEKCWLKLTSNYYVYFAVILSCYFYVIENSQIINQ